MSAVVDALKEALGIRPNKPVWRRGMTPQEESVYTEQLAQWMKVDAPKEVQDHEATKQREAQADARYKERLANVKFDTDDRNPCDRDEFLSAALRPWKGSIRKDDGTYETETNTGFLSRFSLGYAQVVRKSRAELSPIIEARKARALPLGVLPARTNMSAPLAAKMSDACRLKLGDMIGALETGQQFVARMGGKLPLSFYESHSLEAIIDALDNASAPEEMRSFDVFDKK